MKFLCGGCKTKYQISDAKVRGKVLTIRCQSCEARIVVREPSVEEQRLGTYVARLADERVKNVSSQLAVASGASSSSLRSAFDEAMSSALDPEDEAPTRIAQKPDLVNEPGGPDLSAVEWFTAADGAQQGPFSYHELLQRITSREVLPSHYVWNHTMSGWLRVRDSELAKHLPPSMVVLGKPLPPTPPPADANVVDLAARRAERQRPASSTVETPHTATSSPAPEPQDEPRRAPSNDKWSARTEAELPRARPPISKSSPALEQIAEDDASAIAALEVLKELGLDAPPPTEDKTPALGAAAIDAKAAALSSALAGRATPAELVMPKKDVGIDIDLAKDDIFANIPRAAPEPTQIKESTRFFIAMAGVNEKKKRNRIGLIAGGIGAAAFLAFVGAGAFGFVHIPIEGLKSPFDFASRAPDEEVDDDPATLAAGDVNKLAGTDEAKKKKKKAKKPRTVQSPPKDAPSGGYVAENGDAREAEKGTRGGDDAPTGITFDPMGRSKGGLEKTEVRLPDAPVSKEVVLPPVDGAKLSDETVRGVVSSRMGSVRICYETHLKTNENISGRVILEVTVKPSGDVAKVVPSRVPTGANALGDCLVDKVKTWKFPSFPGTEPAIFEVPFLLVNRG